MWTTRISMSFVDTLGTSLLNELFKLNGEDERVRFIWCRCRLILSLKREEWRIWVDHQIASFQRLTSWFEVVINVTSIGLPKNCWTGHFSGFQTVFAFSSLSRSSPSESFVLRISCNVISSKQWKAFRSSCVKWVNVRTRDNCPSNGIV